MLNNNILQKKQVPNNIKDVLFSYFVNEPYTIALAKDKGIAIFEAAEQRAIEAKDTPEGLALYNELIETLKKALKALV